MGVGLREAGGVHFIIIVYTVYTAFREWVNWCRMANGITKTNMKSIMRGGVLQSEQKG